MPHSLDYTHSERPSWVNRAHAVAMGLRPQVCAPLMEPFHYHPGHPSVGRTQAGRPPLRGTIATVSETPILTSQNKFQPFTSEICSLTLGAIPKGTVRCPQFQVQRLLRRGLLHGQAKTSGGSGDRRPHDQAQPAIPGFMVCWHTEVATVKWERSRVALKVPGSYREQRATCRTALCLLPKRGHVDAFESHLSPPTTVPLLWSGEMDRRIYQIHVEHLEIEDDWTDLEILRFGGSHAWSVKTATPGHLERA